MGNYCYVALEWSKIWATVTKIAWLERINCTSYPLAVSVIRESSCNFNNEIDERFEFVRKRQNWNVSLSCMMKFYWSDYDSTWIMNLNVASDHSTWSSLALQIKLSSVGPSQSVINPMPHHDPQWQTSSQPLVPGIMMKYLYVLLLQHRYIPDRPPTRSPTDPGLKK